MNSETRTATAFIIATGLAFAGTAGSTEEDPRLIRLKPAPVTVIDGNHFELNGEVVRLAGIDAPTNEWCTTRRGGCGDQAKKELETIVGSKKVWCTHISDFGKLTTFNGTKTVWCEMVKKGPKRTSINGSRRSR